MRAEVKALAISPTLVQRTVNKADRPVVSAVQSRFCKHALTPKFTKPTCLIEPVESNASLDKEHNKSSNAEGLRSPSFLKFLQTFAEPTSISAKFTDLSSTHYALIIVRRGRIMLQRWTPDGIATYKVQRADAGLGIELTAHISWLSHGRLLIRIFLMRDLSHIFALSMKAGLSFPTLVTRNTETIAAVQAGDIPSLTHLFESKRARPFDTLKNGNSLLHV